MANTRECTTVIDRPPYRTGMGAVKALLQSRMAGACPRSPIGALMDLCDAGMIGTRGSKSADCIPSYLDGIGNLAAAWAGVPTEDRILLTGCAAIPDWHDSARRCRRCGRVYSPTGRRCYRCQTRRLVSEVECPKCGDVRNAYEWGYCPECAWPKWGHVNAKAEQIALLVSEWRRGEFVALTGREPRGWDSRETGRVEVDAASIGGMIADAIARWERVLASKGLIPGRRLP